MKRGYLNREELNQFMVIMAVVQLIKGEHSLEGKELKEMWADWSSRGMMNAEQQKYLKTANTFLNKFIISKLKDLDESEQAKVLKKIQKFDYKLIDDYTLQKLFRDMKDRMEHATMRREDFINWTEEVLYVKCKDCTKDKNCCNFYVALEDNLVPDTGYDLPNCPYAYTLPEKKEA